MQDISLQLQPVITRFKKQVNARAVVLLDPVYMKGDASEIAGLKTEEVTLTMEQLTEYINDFAKNTKKFLGNIHIDDESAPRTVYISTEDRRVFMCRFFVQNKNASESFPIYMGLTIKKDLDAIREGREKEWDYPQYVFDRMWETVKEIQEIYASY